MPVTTNEFIAAVAREGGVVSALNSGLKAVDLDDQNSELAKAGHRRAPMGSIQSRTTW